MTVVRRSPFSEFIPLREAVDRMFDENMLRPLRIAKGKHEAVPALDLYTTPEAVIAEVALPGVDPEKVDITIADDVVTVTGSFKEEDKETTEAGFVHKELDRGCLQPCVLAARCGRHRGCQGDVQGKDPDAHPAEDRAGQAEARQGRGVLTSMTDAVLQPREAGV